MEVDLLPFLSASVAGLSLPLAIESLNLADKTETLFTVIPGDNVFSVS